MTKILVVLMQFPLLNFFNVIQYSNNYAVYLYCELDEIHVKQLKSCCLMQVCGNMNLTCGWLWSLLGLAVSVTSNLEYLLVFCYWESLILTCFSTFSVHANRAVIILSFGVIQIKKNTSDVTQDSKPMEKWAKILTNRSITPALLI